MTGRDPWPVDPRTPWIGRAECESVNETAGMLVVGAALAATGLVTACMDCNDALGKAAAGFAMASQVRLVIDLARVPLALVDQCFVLVAATPFGR
ncbi:hypothetical protein FKR81_00195 [Lentzea tibetensis]|uniref:Uncharacterized protein n=1 Tax=Lentzea tibetensis TaxID=2591470 RepID=A0A563F239_9PSEU|nr:hypothetical protein [Lentzea tibetensis]TWP54030.1 hypothetical protein FKR81_00195 [Lentzea tibetensis]